MRVRWFLRAITAIICLPLVYFAAGFVGAVIPGKHADLAPGTDVLIGLARAPIHYDFLLPLSPELRARYGFAASAGVPIHAPQAEWLLVGWGSEAFYTSAGSYADMQPGAVITAITGDQAVLHLDVAGDVSRVDGIAFLPCRIRSIRRFWPVWRQIFSVIRPGLRWLWTRISMITTHFSRRKAILVCCIPAMFGWARPCARRGCRLGFGHQRRRRWNCLCAGIKAKRVRFRLNRKPLPLASARTRFSISGLLSKPDTL